MISIGDPREIIKAMPKNEIIAPVKTEMLNVARFSDTESKGIIIGVIAIMIPAFIAVVVCSAVYMSPVKTAMPSNACLISQNQFLQMAGIAGRSSEYTNGSIIKDAISQRRKTNVAGGSSGAKARPTT